MCLFTHFAAGALAGGLTGSPGWGALAGLASHAVLDVLPHYDHPDWRLELGGGLAALALLLLMPFASWAAVIGGIAGMMPDLENLFQKLGKMRRDQFVYPTHTGLLKHGRPLGPRNLGVQAAIFVACFVVLGLVRPGTAGAAEDSAAAAAPPPAAVMAAPVVRVVSQTVDRTVVRIDFPVAEAPVDWQAVDPAAVRFALPPVIDDLDDGIGGALRLLPPQLRLTVAVPTRDAPQLAVTDVNWWREPAAGWDPGSLASCEAPAVYRMVPLSGCAVSLSVADGVPAGLTLELRHPAAAPYSRRLEMAGKAEAAPGAETAPDGVVNADLYRALADGAREQARARNVEKAEPFDPFAATTHWVTLAVPATGLYRLTGQQLSGFGVPVGDVDPAKLRVFRGGSLALEMDPEYPDSLQADRSHLNEVAVAVLDGGDGEWNLDDELRFYGVGTSTWRDRLVPGADRLDHYDHPFADEAVYWLTWENDATTSPLPGTPRRVVNVAAPALGGLNVDNVRLRLHLEEQFADSPGVVADDWTWDSSIFSSRTESFTLRTPMAGSGADFVADVRGLYDVFSAGFIFTAKAWLNNDQDQAGTTVISYSAQNDSLRVRVRGQTTSLLAGSNTFTVQNASATQGSRRPLALDSVDILYWTAMSLAPGFGQLQFAHWSDQVPAPGTATDLRLAVPVGELPILWDVTRPDSALALTGTAETGRAVYGLMRDPDQDRHFVAARPADLLAVASGYRVQPISLLDDDDAVDYVVVAAAAFTTAAQDLAAYRSTTLPGVVSPRARVVTAESVYANFSGGQKDPYAIRNYLRRLYLRGGQRLRHVCLLGKASRDYRNYKDRVPLVDLYDLLPTVVRDYFPQFPIPLNRQTPFASDDALCSFDTPPPSAGSRPDLDLPDISCGRLPAVSTQEARAMVDRAIAYAEAPEVGPWRNQVLLTADDVNRPSSGQVPVFGEDAHTREAEDIATNYLPASLDVVKTYGVDYPFPPSSQVKPACRAAINAASQRRHDHFLLRRSRRRGQSGRRADLPVARHRQSGQWRAASRCSWPSVAMSVSTTARRGCPWPSSSCGYTSGGAIGAICASQVSWSTDNDAITEAFFRNLYPARHITADISVGDALRMGKGQMGSLDYRSNSQRYNLMGDPALRLPHPIDDLTLAVGSVDTLRAGARQTVRLSGAGKALLGAGDLYRVRVQESAAARVYPNTPFGGTGSWIESGAAVFNGEGTMGSGDLIIPFKVPSQIRYGDKGRVRLLIETPDGDHAAVQTVPAVRGSTGAVDDVRGPLINLAFENGRFRVRPGDPLTATLTDTSGIAILGTSPGNSLLLELDNNGRMTDVTPSFTYAPDSYTNGSLVFPLPADLIAGAHKAALHASDALGNVGSDTLSFVIVPAGVAGIEDVTLFPNPTPGPCRLLFELSDPMAVQWDIYTLAGGRLRTLRENYTEAGPRILEWDGRDTMGDEIANGTYLYVLRGTGPAADGREIRKTGKLVIMR